MKFLGVTLASLGLVSAASVSNQQAVSYDQFKVFRINGPSNTDKFQEVVKKLQLDVWKGKPSSGDVVDVSVAPEQLSAFQDATKDLDTKIMHENLGASIADENTFSVYAGMYRCFRLETRLSTQQLARLPTRPGSTHTTPSPTTTNGLLILLLRIHLTLKLSLLASRSKAATSRVSTSGVAAARALKRLSSGTAPCMPESGSPLWSMSTLLTNY